MNKKFIQKTKNDEMMTPEYAVEPIIQYLIGHGKDNTQIKVLCPFDNKDSAFVKVLNTYNIKVYWSHINIGRDFFSITKDEVVEFDFIISNPPYSRKDQVLKHLYYLGKPFAMLMPLNAIGGVTRGQLFEKHGIELLVFDKRINFNNLKNVSFHTGYFCWKMLGEQLIFHKLKVSKCKSN